MTEAIYDLGTGKTMLALLTSENMLVSFTLIKKRKGHP